MLPGNRGSLGGFHADVVWLLLSVPAGGSTWGVGNVPQAHRGDSVSSEFSNKHDGTKINLSRTQLICVRLFVTPWTVACQAPLSMEFSRQEEWVTSFFSRGSSGARDRTHVSCIAGRF